MLTACQLRDQVLDYFFVRRAEGAHPVDIIASIAFEFDLTEDQVLDILE